MEISDMQLPEWAKWIAQDESGVWWVYECEPLQHSTGWYENEVGRYQKLRLANEKPVPNLEWRSTLKKVG